MKISGGVDDDLSIWRAWLLVVVILLTTTTHAATGPEVAQLLNRNFQYTARECAGNPAYFCSGVLARVSPTTGTFWQHGSVSTSLGAENFAYLRADLGTRALTGSNGMLFSDRFTAISQNKELEILCAYPFEFALQGSRPDSGCGWVPAKAAAGPASASCSTQGVTDAQSWLAHFQRQNLQPTAQCSLSGLQSAEFLASLIAHESLGATWSARPTQIQIKNWDASAPKQMPVLGLFYDITQTGALLNAQKDQHDYFVATGDWLPILRMDLAQAPAAVFGFNQQDQLYIGYQVAAKQNARYTNTAADCQDAKPAFYCNGVLIRGADASSNFHAWNPSPNSIGRNGVSFSYVRSDVGTVTLAGIQGFTFLESFAPVSHPTLVRCSYPVNAGTSGIPDSCRVSCDSQNVTTVALWQARYASNPGSSCAFSDTPASFQLSIAVRSVLSAAARNQWNEVIIAVWPQNIPLQIPLESIFYVSGNVAGLNNAKFIQRDYYQQTSRFIPVVRMNLAAADKRPFSYELADQSVKGASMQELIKGITPRRMEDY